MGGGGGTHSKNLHKQKIKEGVKAIEVLHFNFTIQKSVCVWGGGGHLHGNPKQILSNNLRKCLVRLRGGGGAMCVPVYIM